MKKIMMAVVIMALMAAGVAQASLLQVKLEASDQGTHWDVEVWAQTDMTNPGGVSGFQFDILSTGTVGELDPKPKTGMGGELKTETTFNPAIAAGASWPENRVIKTGYLKYLVASNRPVNQTTI